MIPIFVLSKSKKGIYTERLLSQEGDTRCSCYCIVHLCPVCFVALPKWVLDCHGGTCMNCASVGHKVTLSEAPSVRGVVGDVVLDGGAILHGSTALEHLGA